jgi:hypothetical protein
MRLPACLRRRLRAVAWLAALLPAAGLGGCLIGVNTLQAPQPPELRPYAAWRGARVVFDVCPSPELAPRAARAVRTPWQDELPTVLRRDFGMAAQAGWPPDDAAALYVRVRLARLDTPRGLGLVSGVLSALTFSIIPGAYQEVHPVAFELYAGGPGETLQRVTLHYEYRLNYWIWLPLIVYPDFLIPVHTDADWERRQLDPVIQRFVADADARLAAAGAGPVPAAARTALHGCEEPAPAAGRAATAGPPARPG